MLMTVATLKNMKSVVWAGEVVVHVGGGTYLLEKFKYINVHKCTGYLYFLYFQKF